jgi:hypothetical protein
MWHIFPCLESVGCTRSPKTSPKTDNAGQKCPCLFPGTLGFGAVNQGVSPIALNLWCWKEAHARNTGSDQQAPQLRSQSKSTNAHQPPDLRVEKFLDESNSQLLSHFQFMSRNRQAILCSLWLPHPLHREHKKMVVSSLYILGNLLYSNINLNNYFNRKM